MGIASRFFGNPRSIPYPMQWSAKALINASLM